ncbi:MAG: hypothetical protein ACK55Z_13500, partial [bacterium]
MREELVLGELQPDLLRIELETGVDDVGRQGQRLVPAVLLVEGHGLGGELERGVEQHGVPAAEVVVDEVAQVGGSVTQPRLALEQVGLGPV